MYEIQRGKLRAEQRMRNFTINLLFANIIAVLLEVDFKDSSVSLS